MFSHVADTFPIRFAQVDGLLEVTKVQPEDPIDFLAEFLFKYSVGSEAQRTGIAS